MSRSEKNRSVNSDEIPLAQRSSTVRSSQLKKIRFLLRGLFITLISFSFYFLFFFNSGQLVLKTQNNDINALNTSDITLLGHFPYKEALKEDLISVYPGLEVHKDTYKALTEMSSAALKDGIKLVLLSGFRSIELQRSIFYERKSARNQVAIERAKVSAPPGYSEHSTGFAIDLGDGTMRQTDFEVDFENTPAFNWLNKNAARYHFILSFPKGNPQGVSYEPWHWRYEGTVEALEKFKKANNLLMKKSKYD